ncbi:hypothetical protein F9C11_19595 [Amycolatopsis sp. VS8301801F10]|uniref:hypothetical protein n=1 Tax=unclassified Amycolatopsis TaxID=2618356 RepID=UPI0038FC6405
MPLETGQPSRARVALTGVLHGVSALAVCALVLCGISAVLLAAGQVLSAPGLVGLIVLASYLHVGLYLVPIAAGIGALAASLGSPERAKRRVWITLSVLSVLFPAVVFATATMQLA